MDGERTLYTDNLLYIESQKHKAFFYYMQAGITTFQLYEKLDHIEKLLSAHGFLRIHKSYLVNMERVKTFLGDRFLMDNGAVVPISQSRRKAVKQEFLSYMGSAANRACGTAP